MIKSVDIEIGGVLIDSINGEFINLYHELYLESGHQKGYDKLIGNIDDLKNYSSTKESYELQIPLNIIPSLICLLRIRWLPLM